ncbi:aldehyde dehydrogenase [Mycolicibacterium sp.]|uniref:aldehyde dehydrogenase n=1 Tax=Mycolicibacterium sp. TaxID=2320850 RepID=UPI003D0E5249
MASVVSEVPGLLAGGVLRSPDSQVLIPVVNPATEDVIGHVADASAADVDAVVGEARRAFSNSGWAQLSYAERARHLDALARTFDTYRDALAAAVTDQNGFPIGLSTWVNTMAPQAVYDTFARMGAQFVDEEPREGYDGTTTIVAHQPLGVAGFILPWNAPHLLLAFKMAPALLAGNTVVFKAAPETSLDLPIFAEAVAAAGIPPGVINFITGGRDAGERLVRHPGIAKVGFTGSTEGGRAVAAACGQELKAVTLELGGKSAAIVCEDADLDDFTSQLPMSLLPATGQVCYATTRVLAPRSRYDEVVDAVSSALSAIPVGDPHDPESVWGPIVTARQRDRVQGYIDAGVLEGAKLVTGGGRPPALPTGFYIEPTVFRDVDNAMTIAREEIFGPVVCVIPYDDERHAIEIANDSDFGLGGTVHTADHEHGLDIARQIDTGSIGVNRYGVDYNAPYGGFKHSGVGRELGPEAVRSYQQVKSIYA